MGLASESRARSFALAQLSRLEPGVCEHPNGSTVLRAGSAHRTQAVKSHQPQTALACEIVDLRPDLKSLVTLATRRLQPLGHLTARGKLTLYSARRSPRSR